MAKRVFSPMQWSCNESGLCLNPPPVDFIVAVRFDQYFDYDVWHNISSFDATIWLDVHWSFKRGNDFKKQRFKIARKEPRQLWFFTTLQALWDSRISVKLTAIAHRLRNWAPSSGISRGLPLLCARAVYASPSQRANSIEKYFRAIFTSDPDINSRCPRLAYLL